jgi:hypothetical protein
MHAAAFFFQSASDIIQGLTISINVAKQTITAVCIIVNRMASGLQPDAGRDRVITTITLCMASLWSKGKQDMLWKITLLQN